MGLTDNALQGFQVGQQIGNANSPVTGIGLAIQNIVDDARKKGLLAAQSQFQTEGADVLSIRKEERATAAAEDAGTQPKGGFITDKATGKMGLRNATYDPNTRQWVEKITPASFDLVERMMGGAGGETDPLESTLNEILTELFAKGE